MLEKELVGCGAIKFGDFTFTSGIKSKFYFDMKYAATRPGVYDAVATELAKLVKAPVVAGVELGAIPWVSAVALKKGIPFIMIRKEQREHGVKDPVIGDITNGMEVDIIEDVVTTGGTVMRAIDLLRSRGAKVSRVISIADWEKGGANNLKEKGIELSSVFKASDVLKLVPQE